MKYVHIIWGRTGEYEDKREWIVAIYDRKTQAEKHKKLAEEYVKKALAHGADRWSLKNPYDLRLWYDGYVNYSISKEPVLQALPKFKDI